MKLYLHNTLSRKKELFLPINNNHIGMYVCGPTVYDSPHIGNARSVVVYDLLYRILRKLYGNESVLYVRNITDVDDKINDRAKELGITINQLTEKTTNGFWEDVSYLHCLKPNIEPKATENIEGMISIIEKLINNNHAYLSNGHIYFDVTSYKDYYSLSGRKMEEMLSGVRIEVEKTKKNPADFVLWKPASENDDPSSIFKSPWGDGRPGWHIECSAMSYRFLGENFDIHGGGVDLIFPHHTNEIAQSCCAFEKSKFANYWVHNGFLTVSGEKMSKSLGNFITVEDLRKQKIKGEVIRYLLLSTHYSKPLDFNDKAIYDSGESLNYLYRVISILEEHDTNESSDNLDEFLSLLLDDMNTSEALRYLHEKAKEFNKEQDQNKKISIAKIIKKSGNLMGILNYKSSQWFKGDVDSKWIDDAIEERNLAKKNRDFTKADKIREDLAKEGVVLEDTEAGTIWRISKV